MDDRKLKTRANAMSKFEDRLSIIYAEDRAAWRSWLEQNHRDLVGVWLVYYKVNSGKPSIKYSEAVREALCFGWIDSKVQTLDADRYRQIFTPRKPQSVWSKLNKQYVAELIELGLMTESGLAKIEAAKLDGSWRSLDEVEALIVPEDLQCALVADTNAESYFAAFSNTNKKNILQWLQSAKRPQTRVDRIAKIIAAAAQNCSPLDRSGKTLS